MTTLSKRAYFQASRKDKCPNAMPNLIFHIVWSIGHPRVTIWCRIEMDKRRRERRMADEAIMITVHDRWLRSEDILEEFPHAFDCVKSLCRDVRTILFPLTKAGKLDLETPADSDFLYDPIIKTFGDAIAGQGAASSAYKRYCSTALVADISLPPQTGVVLHSVL
jgi:hypothetical protein